MKKRGARHSTRRDVNAIALAMHGASLLAKHDQTVQALNTRMAIDDVLRGTRSVENWRVVFDMTNLIEELCRNPRVARGAGEFVTSLQGAIVAIMDRHKANGSTAMHASEAAVLNDAHALFVELLSVITYRDLSQAQAGVSERIRHALASREPGVVVVEMEG